MSQNLFLGFPMPVALALAALIVGLLALARVMTSLGKPGRLRIPDEEHDPAYFSDLERRLH